MANYYQILEVEENASAETIKASYRRLAKIYHPDMNIVKKDFAEVQMKLINQAYDVLSNPEKRMQYDAQLHPPVFIPLRVYVRYGYGNWGINISTASTNGYMYGNMYGNWW
jgi:DnaJ-class molecular chaperone